MKYNKRVNAGAIVFNHFASEYRNFTRLVFRVLKGWTKAIVPMELIHNNLFEIISLREILQNIEEFHLKEIECSIVIHYNQKPKNNLQKWVFK